MTGELPRAFGVIFSAKKRTRVDQIKVVNKSGTVHMTGAVAIYTPRALGTVSRRLITPMNLLTQAGMLCDILDFPVMLMPGERIDGWASGTNDFVIMGVSE